jgi:hypothetical protein
MADLEQNNIVLVQEKLLGSLSTSAHATYLTRQGTEVARPRYISLAPVVLGF